MSKAVKAVTKAVGGVVGGIGKTVFGGGGSDSPGMLGTGRFKGATRKIDKDAFKIKDVTALSNQSKRLANESEVRSKTAQGNRSQLISQLQSQADGTAPSLAEAQLRSATDRNLAQQLAAAQAQRGGNVAAQQRQLMQNQATAGRELAQDASTARLQERQMAQELLGQQISQEQQLSDQLVQNYLAQGFSMEQARQQAAADYEKAQTAQFLQAQGLTAQGFEGSAARRAELGPQMMQNASSLLSFIGASDKNTKRKTKKASKKDVSEALQMSSKDSKKNIKKYKTPKSIKKSHKSLMKSADKVTETKKDKKEETPADRRKKLSQGLSDLSKAGKRASQKSRSAVAAASPRTSFSSLMSELSDETSKINKKEIEVNKSDSSELKSDTKAQTTAPGKVAKKEKSGMDLQSLAKIAPMLAAASDKNSKKDMEAYSDERIKKDFLDKLQAYTYEYKDKYKKDPRAGEGRHMSVMAQDLEKTPLGSEMVKEDSNGMKMVDYAKGYGAILAAQAHLNKRLDELEKKGKPKKRK